MSFLVKALKARLKKIVRYKLIEDLTYSVYNLSFGDWNETTGGLDDAITTNNNDRQKVLSTVAATVLDFTNTHHDAFVFAQGSTSSRTRLYQMGISAFWHEIGDLFMVMGFMDDEWRSFEKRVNYQAFLIKRK